MFTKSKLKKKIKNKKIKLLAENNKPAEKSYLVCSEYPLDISMRLLIIRCTCVNMMIRYSHINIIIISS